LDDELGEAVDDVVDAAAAKHALVFEDLRSKGRNLIYERV
jgi:hypothetical protein